VSDFFTGYRKVSLLPDEVLVDIFVPFCNREWEFVVPFKVSAECLLCSCCILAFYYRDYVPLYL
jgi:hypothetical protein